MHRNQVIPGFALCLLAAGSAAPLAVAVQPSDQLLPSNTKGYVSIAQFEEFCTNFDRTQIGQFLLDESMQPFQEDLERQVDREFDAINDKFGIKLDDIEEISAGEVALGLIGRDEREAAIAIVADITGRHQQAEDFLAKAEQEFARRGGTRETTRVGNNELVELSLPPKDDKRPFRAVYFIKDDMLCFVDDRGEAQAMLSRIGGNGEGSLSAVPAYQAANRRCREEATGSLQPELRWYVEPFDFAWAWRSLEHRPLPLEKDLVKILHDNGFDAIQGIAGYVNLMVGPKLEFVQRTFVYAPPVAGKENDPLRWNSSMQMMQLPNSEQLSPEVFVPEKVASYSTANVEIINAYEHVNAVADDLIGYEDAFKTTIEGLEVDPYGPEVRIGDEFIAHLGNRASVFRDYVTPISPESERYLYAVVAKNPDSLSATLAKIMENDPAHEKEVIGDIVVWVIKEGEYEFDDYEGAAFGPLDGEDFGPPAEEEDSLLQNSAACVAEGYLFLASDVNFIREVLATSAVGQHLIKSDDYRAMETALHELAPGPLCGMTFCRTDEAFRPSFELIRQGKMPEAKTSVGRLLNELLTTQVEEEKGITRTQRIDGSKLPEFEQVAEYFHLAGQTVRSVDDGWILTGAMFNSEVE